MRVCMDVAGAQFNQLSDVLPVLSISLLSYKEEFCVLMHAVDQCYHYFVLTVNNSDCNCSRWVFT